MDIVTIYTTALTPFIPFFSALSCGILVVFSLQDCDNNEERKLKCVVLFYLFLSAIAWFITFSYEFAPVLFVWLNTACLISYLLAPIFFYRIIRYLTRLGHPEEFSSLHYLLPGVLVATMIIWSLFVPFKVQLEIVMGKAQVFPAGYEAYTRFFTLKPLLRVVFGLVYYMLALRVLMEYYKIARKKKVRLRKPARWVFFLVCISLASLLVSVSPAFMTRSDFVNSLWILLVAAGIAAQHVLLSYHIMRRDYSPYIIPAKRQKRPSLRDRSADADIVEVPSSPRRQYSGKLDRQLFEEFIRNKKPYLNPNYKMTNLVDDLDVNRTSLSAFINQTYGMNFNRYLNHLRLKELEQLRSLPGNEGRSISSLLGNVGFKYFRNYARANAAERENPVEEVPPEEKKGETT